ncbi:hypothetical protein GOBAR_DD31348 [Gossypium barbadense]|nr:hypothetical protein GOBAR_DD31348 [Gossypium barbadense]
MASLRAKAPSTHGSRKQRKFSASWTRFGRWMRDPPTAQPWPLPVLQSKWAWAVVASAWAVAAGVRRVGVWGADGDGHAGVCWSLQQAFYSCIIGITPGLLAADKLPDCIKSQCLRNSICPVIRISNFLPRCLQAQDIVSVTPTLQY